VESLGNRIDEVFVYIGAAILAIELVEGWIRGSLKGRTFGDMFASASTQVPSILIDTVVLTTAYGLYVLAADAFVTWSLPLTVATVVAAVFVADFIYYWEHRLAHEIRFLWLHHAVHHSSRFMNISTGVRFGPFEGVWTMIALFPMVLMGFPPELILLGHLIVLAYQTWIHTELIGKLGPVEWVLNTPSHHRVHHGCDDKYLDRNYGGILIVWDRMFGTFQAEEETPRYGLKRDFDSVNPLVVWFSELPQYFRDLRSAGSWHEAWMLTFGPPGWSPQPRGKRQAKRPVDIGELSS
jgi:sterol desaturase/sphingolipid hydroxylase (fatty acid hydroxylase superfamily)